MQKYLWLTDKTMSTLMFVFKNRIFLLLIYQSRLVKSFCRLRTKSARYVKLVTDFVRGRWLGTVNVALLCVNYLASLPFIWLDTAKTYLPFGWQRKLTQNFTQTSKLGMSGMNFCVRNQELAVWPLLLNISSQQFITKVFFDIK